MTMTTKTVSLDNIVTQAEDLVSTEIDGEVVLMSIENSDYYGFEKILSRIWEIIEKPIAISALIDQLIQEYDVERAECESDVTNILNEMLAEKLISVQ